MQASRNPVYRRQDIVDGLRRMGLPEVAEEALRDLPDPVDVDQLGIWGMRHGITRDDVISRMGGSP